MQSVGAGGIHSGRTIATNKHSSDTSVAMHPGQGIVGRAVREKCTGCEYGNLSAGAHFSTVAIHRARQRALKSIQKTHSSKQMVALQTSGTAFFLTGIVLKLQDALYCRSEDGNKCAMENFCLFVSRR